MILKEKKKKRREKTKTTKEEEEKLSIKKYRKKIKELKEKYNKEKEEIKKKKEELKQELNDKIQNGENKKQAKKEYKEELKKLRKELKETKKRYSELKWTQRGKIAKPFLEWAHEGYGKHALKISPAIALFIAGLVVSGISTWFFWGFLAASLFVLVPPARGVESKHEGPLGWSVIWPTSDNYGGKHVTFGFFKTVFKVSAFVCFAFGFQSIGPNFNTLFLITAVIGYFSLKGEYDPEIPSEFLEGLFRLGAGVLLSVYVFTNVFQSWTLGMLALAFFAVPPVPKKGVGNISEVLSRGLSGQTMYYEMFDKAVFSLLMIVSLIGALGFFGNTLGVTGWGLTPTLKVTFIYFWVVCGIGGFFSPAGQRPVTGTLMLSVATVIYGVGPGSQIIGSGLFGDWWPSVHNFFMGVFGPISDAFGQVGNTFGSAWFMLTNPVGYATQLMNGSYTTNPTGLTGAYGLEITNLGITDLYVTQPYIITVILENQGSQKAENIRLKLCSGMAGLSTLKIYDDERVPIGKSQLSLGINSVNGKLIDNSIYEFCDYDPEEFDPYDIKSPTENGCIELKSNAELPAENKLLAQQGTIQRTFSSTTGISCKTVVEKNLIQRYIPIIAEVTYDYKVYSTLEMEFITPEEWASKAGELTSQMKKSEMTTSPAKLSIGTVNQPIMSEQTPFYIGLKMQSAEGEDSRINWANIELRYPVEFGKPLSCTGTCDSAYGGQFCLKPKKEGDTYVLKLKAERKEEDDVPNPITTDTFLFYCNFKPLSGDTITGPTKTYIVTTESNYSFSRWKTVNTKINFGGVKCCEKNSDCGEGMLCGDNNICGGGGATAAAGSVEVTTVRRE